MRVKIEIIKKCLRDIDTFQYDEKVFDLWEKETFGDVSLPEMADLIRKATRNGSDELLPSEIAFVFYKALSIKEEKFVNEIYYLTLNVSFNKKNIFDLLEAKNVFPSLPIKKQPTLPKF